MTCLIAKIQKYFINYFTYCIKIVVEAIKLLDTMIKVGDKQSLQRLINKDLYKKITELLNQKNTEIVFSTL